MRRITIIGGLVNYKIEHKFVLYYRNNIEKGSDDVAILLFVFLYITPIVAILFFLNCVSLAKKINNGNPDTANNTGWGAIMFGFIIFSIIWSISMHFPFH
jgi:hypothetical protein